MRWSDRIWRWTRGAIGNPPKGRSAPEGEPEGSWIYPDGSYLPPAHPHAIDMREHQDEDPSSMVWSFLQRDEVGRYRVVWYDGNRRIVKVSPSMSAHRVSVFLETEPGRAHLYFIDYSGIAAGILPFGRRGKYDRVNWWERPAEPHRE